MTPLLAPSLRPDRGFERIYRRHVGDVYRYALAMLRNPADAEDVTQTTFLNAYRAYQRGERPRAAQNWLITIAHNVCRQRFRQSERRVQEVTLNEDLAEALGEDDDNTAPTIGDIQRALGHLPFNQRSALVMRELEGRSYAEIAQTLELSVSAVETLLFRARRTLREQLEGTLTCREAELALSRQLDGRLSNAERGPLRAHLRECKECARLARKQRAQSAAIKALGAIPLPPSLTSWGSLFGGGAAGGAAAVGGGLALKAAAVVTAGAVVVGVTYEGAKRVEWIAGDEAAPKAVAAAEASKSADARADADARAAGVPAATRGSHVADGSGLPPNAWAAGGLPVQVTAVPEPVRAGRLVLGGRHEQLTDEGEGEVKVEGDTPAKGKPAVTPAAPSRGRGHGGRPAVPGPPAGAAGEPAVDPARLPTLPASERAGTPPGQERSATGTTPPQQPLSQPRGRPAETPGSGLKVKDKDKVKVKDKDKDKVKDVKEKPKDKPKEKASGGSTDDVQANPNDTPKDKPDKPDKPKKAATVVPPPVDGTPAGDDAAEAGDKAKDKDKDADGSGEGKKDEVPPPAATVPPPAATVPTPAAGTPSPPPPSPDPPSDEDKDKDKEKEKEKDKP